jgi:hypothetical protein
MNLLPLDDPRWKKLEHRNWRDGKPSEWAPDAPFIPNELAKLIANPADIECFGDLWPWFCSEDTTYAAAYAVVPYLVHLAKQLPREQRSEYLCVIGLVVTHSNPTGDPCRELKDFLAESYYAALSEALPLTADTLCENHNLLDTRYLLATVAALKGHRRLANVLQDIGCMCGECPKCGEVIYPDELQEVIS